MSDYVDPNRPMDVSTFLPTFRSAYRRAGIVSPDDTVPWWADVLGSISCFERNADEEACELLVRAVRAVLATPEAVEAMVAIGLRYRSPELAAYLRSIGALPPKSSA